MTIGELLKDYRIKQRKTQKQWVGNVMSASFYTKVERGLSRISAEDLINLLHYNQILLIDFFGKLSKNYKSFYQQKQQINRLTNEAYYHDSKQELKQLWDIVSKSELPNKDDELLLIDTYIAVINKDFTHIDQKLIDKMKERILSITDFDEDGLIIYCNLMSFYDLNSNLLLSKRIIEQFIGSTSTKIQKIILGIIITMLVFCIQNKKFEKTEVFVNYAAQIKTQPDIFFYKMLIPIFDNIIKYQYEHDRKYMEVAQKLIESVKLAGMPDYNKDLEKFHI